MDKARILEEKINIDISACIYGAKVRYNKKAETGMHFGKKMLS